MMKKLTTYFVLLLGVVAFSSTQAQQSYIFTAAGAVGSTGPTQGMVNTAYSSTNLNGKVTAVGGIQYWVVPSTGTYQIEAWGGQGYGSFGGRGAYISGDFPLLAGDTLKILVGQMAGPYLNYPATTYNHQFGGGGGSFITTTNNTPYVVAGGGGGNHGTSYVTSCDGQITTNGASGANGSTIGAGGTGGMGGLQASSADGGGGLLGNGTGGGAQGISFINGGLGGNDEGFGGFGCGGGTSSWNNYRGGGGGGYSGGGGGNNGGSCCPAGGGGGSFNSGTNQIATAGVQTGDGMVVITPLTRVPNDAGVSEILGFNPPVCKGNYSVDVVVRNFGNNQISPVTVQWSVNGVAQPDSTYTGVLDTINGTGPDSVLINLGNVAITGATSIKVWTTLPNNTTDSSNFNDTTEIMIAAPAAITSVINTSVSCNGLSDGALSAIVSGGTPGYSYSWSTNDTISSISGLTAGNYTLVITDNNGCKDSATFTVTQPNPLIGVDIITNISCFGMNDGQVFLNPQGGTPGYITIWSPSDTTNYINSLSAGYHTYTIIDANGCVYVDSSLITEPTALMLSSTTSNETTSPGNDGAVDLTVSGGTPAYSYLWSTGSFNQDISGLTAGTYSVVVTDANGCMDSITVTVNKAGVGINESTISLGCSIYPNPSNGNFTVSISNSNDEREITIDIYDIAGKLVKKIENANPTTSINLAEKSGFYIVKITNGSLYHTQQIIVN